ncbi:MAG: transketolase family protein [Christensenellales bacterium]
MADIEMRVVLAQELKKMMENDPKVVVIDADLAKASGTWGLRKDFPDRAIDVGIAEQNMVSIASGMASYGYKPFITSFTPFVSRRVCDQITLSSCYAKQPITIIGTDPGICAEINGGTHMGMEDIGVLRSIADIVIFEPVDAIQLRQALPVIANLGKTIYIRLFRKKIDDVFSDDYKFDLFKTDTIKEGKDVTIFCTGIMVQETVKAIELLEKEGIDAEIVNVHTIKPIDKEGVIKSVAKTGCAVTAENHNIIGGLFSAVSEVLTSNMPVPVLPVGVPDTFGEVGKMPYLKQIYKMTAQDIVDKAKQAIELKNKFN